MTEFEERGLGFERVDAIVPRSNITAAMRHVIDGFGLLRLTLCWRRVCIRAHHCSVHLRQPAVKRCEISHIDDIPKFFCGVPSCAKCFDSVFFCVGRDQIDSHKVNYPRIKDPLDKGEDALGLSECQEKSP